MELLKFFALLEKYFPCGEKGRNSISHYGDTPGICIDVWFDGQVNMFVLDDISELDDPEKLLDDIIDLLNTDD